MLRYREFLGESSPEIERFTSSIEEDREIHEYIIAVYAAHLLALYRHGYIPESIASRIAKELLNLLTLGNRAYDNVVDGLYEDFFEALESYLHRKLGSIAGYLALGRSRNDHVATVLRLYARDRLLEILAKILKLRKVLVSKAEEVKDKILPFHTHSRIAQLCSASHLFLAMESSLRDAWRALLAAMEILSTNPLGSGPACRTVVYLDPEVFRQVLGLRDSISPYYATSSRLPILMVLALISVIMCEISRFIQELMLLFTDYANLIELPREHVATSSAMPHKKNPVTLEIAKAKIGTILGHLNAALSIYRAVGYGYNLDLQEMNIHTYTVFQETLRTLDILTDLIRGLDVKDMQIESERLCTYLSYELSELEALRTRSPFREVYRRFSRVIHVEGKTVSCSEVLDRVLDIDRCRVVKEIAEARSVIAVNEEILRALQKEIAEYRAKLLEELRSLAMR